MERQPQNPELLYKQIILNTFNNVNMACRIDHLIEMCIAKALTELNTLEVAKA